jgi:phosphatidylserine decarboxylase
VGALSVGRIIQVHPLGAPYQRGDEKSVFRFGGSAIVVFGEPGAMTLIGAADVRSESFTSFGGRVR